MKDERTTQVMQRIHSEMTVIMILLCALSMVVKVLLFEKSINDCILEWIILVGSPIYQVTRARMLKVSLSSGTVSLKRNLRSTVISVIVLLAAFGITAIIHPERMTMKFVVSFLIPYVIVLLLLRVAFARIEARYVRKLEHEYDD